MFDLSPYRRIAVKPVTGAIGAEIDGVDASADIPSATAEELRQALAQFHVLFFRDQQLDEPGVEAFARNFGPLGKSALSADRDTPPFVHKLYRAAETPSYARNTGDRWHSDRPSDETPPKGFVLYCEQAPDYGGDTIFASLCEAYDALPAVMQDFCKGLTGIHSMSGLFNMDGTHTSKRDLVSEGLSNDRALQYIRSQVEHPLVCRHPETGRPYLFVSGAYLIGVKGLNEKESAGLIDQLNQHVVRPEFTCRFRWRKGSIAVLNNRCTQHYAVGDYAGFTRSMLRVELRGDWRPVSVDRPPPNPDLARQIEHTRRIA